MCAFASDCVSFFGFLRDGGPDSSEQPLWRGLNDRQGAVTTEGTGYFAGTNKSAHNSVWQSVLPTPRTHGFSMIFGMGSCARGAVGWTQVTRTIGRLTAPA